VHTNINKWYYWIRFGVVFIIYVYNSLVSIYPCIISTVTYLWYSDTPLHVLGNSVTQRQLPIHVFHLILNCLHVKLLKDKKSITQIKGLPYQVLWSFDLEYDKLSIQVFKKAFNKKYYVCPVPFIKGKTDLKNDYIRIWVYTVCNGQLTIWI